MSDRCCLFVCFSVILILSVPTSAYTDISDVQALQDIYVALKSPQQLKGWRSIGGDPCEDPWKGISCNGSSVIHIKIPNQNLTGFLGYQLANLVNLKQLDVSYNNIEGEIPYSLPQSLTHLVMSFNNFSNSIPYSLSSLKFLRRVNLSHNSLSGSIGNIFTSLTYLREMDLSYNNLTGDLPSSFGSLIRLTKLFLQSNGFTGSVVFLIDLPLTDLNIQDNHFSGVLPSQFQSIPNLWMGGNRFDIGSNSPAWDFAWENIHNETNITNPPSSASSAIESYAPHEESSRKKQVGTNKVAFIVGACAFVALCAGLVLAVHIRRSGRDQRAKLSESSEASLYSLPVSSTARELSSTPLESSPVVSDMTTPGGGTSNSLTARVRTFGISRRRSLNKKNRMLLGVKLYTVSELQLATNFFSADNLIGTGSLGSVYKAELPDGKINAVKKVEMISLSLKEEDQFMDAIWNVSRLKHLNIVKLAGFCVERGQHFIVYEYVRNLSLSDALHCEAYMPLSWGLRVRIALGIARALNYLHSTCVPPVAHGCLKAANVLLDQDLMPRVCDSGLAVLKPLTTSSVKQKASEMAICDSGYIAPDSFQSGTHSCTMDDIYAFGVLLLELFTGRKPFDSKRASKEQNLAKWAWSQLHDNESLEQMVDPSIKKTIPSKALSRFADIVSLCIQPKEFRPPMSEIVESLVFLLQQNRNSSCFGNEGTDGEPSEFRSANTHFYCSPTVSYRSV